MNLETAVGRVVTHKVILVGSTKEFMGRIQRKKAVNCSFQVEYSAALRLAPLRHRAAEMAPEPERKSARAGEAQQLAEFGQ